MFHQRPAAPSFDLASLATMNIAEGDMQLPPGLHYYIRHIVINKQFDAIQALYSTIATQHAGHISLDPIASTIYPYAISSYSVDEFKTLSNAVPIDINQPLIHSLNLMHEKPQLKRTSLLHLAVTYHAQDLFNYLIVLGADVMQLSHEGKTAVGALQKEIEQEKHWPDDLPKLKEMLAVAESKVLSHSSARYSPY